MGAGDSPGGGSRCLRDQNHPWPRGGGLMTVDVQQLNRAARAQRDRLEPLYREMAKVLVGQRGLLDRLLVGLLTGGHVLIEGVPGLAKTLAVRTLARGLRLHFSRIQFT